MVDWQLMNWCVVHIVHTGMFRIDRLYSGEVHVCVHEDVERGVA